MIKEAGDWRQQARLQKRLLHNRTAQALNKHVTGPFQGQDDLVCTVCGKTTKISNFQWFFKEEEGSPAKEGAPRALRASARINQRKQLVLAYNKKAHEVGNHLLHVPLNLDDEPMRTAS